MAKDSRWMQKASKRMKKKGTVGSFTSWCKSHGYGGVTSECIAAGKRAGGKIAQKANFAANARKARHAQGGMIEGDLEEYSLGGIFGEVGKGAAMGAGAGAMAGGITAVPGAILGGIGGLFKGLLGHRQENIANVRAERAQAQQEQMMTTQQEALQDAKTQSYLASLGGNYNPYTPTFPMGGLLPYKEAEVEGEEVLQRPSGKLRTIKGPKHSQGGVDVEEPSGTRVYSDRVIYEETGRTFAEEADLIRKRIAELDKKLA